jgi:hypothetical protein
MDVRASVALFGVALLGAVGLTAVAERGGPGGSTTQGSRPVIEAQTPWVVTLEGAHEDVETRVRLRRFGAQAAMRELGLVRHAEHAGRRGALWRRGTRVAVLVTAALTAPSARTYASTLFLVEGGTTRPLANGVANLTPPLVTSGGWILVQRGREGPPPPEHERRLLEREDELAIDVVDPDTAATRTVFRGVGQTAWLGCALREDRAVLYHVTREGAFVRLLDARSGTTRSLLGPIPALARDFSCDLARDEVTFARAADIGSDTYEVVTLSISDGALRVRHRGDNDHFMPRILSDGTLALSPAQDPGLALLARESVNLRSLSPSGPGSDEVLAEHPSGQWLLVRHLDPRTRTDTLIVLGRDGTRGASFEARSSPVDPVDFWTGGTP